MGDVPVSAQMIPRDLTRVFRGPLTLSRWELFGRFVPALLYLTLIHIISSVEGGDLPVLLDDRVAHFLEYFGLGALLYLAASGFDRLARTWSICLVVVLFAAAYGAIDEFHQSFVPGRDSSVKDLAFDALGATIAACSIRWIAWGRVAR